MIDNTADSNVVNFWVNNKFKFPKLFLCAREILGVPCSSATSKRAFSISGQISSKKRSSRSSKIIEELSIIRLNKETIWRYKLSHKVQPKPPPDLRIEEDLIDREPNDSDTEEVEELDDFDVGSDFEEGDLEED